MIKRSNISSQYKKKALLYFLNNMSISRIIKIVDTKGKEVCCIYINLYLYFCLMNFRDIVILVERLAVYIA